MILDFQIFLTILHILAMFRISKEISEDGTVVEPAVRYKSDGVVR